MKYFLTLALALSLSVPALAAKGALESPVTQKGNTADAEYAGTNTCVVDNSTGTTALLCDSGKGIILEVIGSSVTSTDYLTFRDSDTANTSSTELLRVSQGDLSSVNVWPRYSNGLSVNASVAPDAGSGAWTVIYLPLD